MYLAHTSLGARRLQLSPVLASRAAAFEVATLLDTGLSKEATKTVMELCEAGVNPEALAAVIKELRDEAARIQPARNSSSSK